MIMIIALTIIFLVAVAIKTINYGRWSAGQGNWRGAIGLYVIALLLLALPAAVYIYNQVV
ncbi:hypothetical protein SPSYN_02220 [Sporotomaculum syntrophicum]|uniref:Uncharacterized protein n=1 Tax=Sporotomaculum syntrophicum TaxID=182264 RepID=A0A9D2WNH6_9FIRM|nr:hypothetical protein [Sporotomaculum syntrophicum]KAF1084443.1 hypothetical protein SPSYN_02220 [Sporotomaculum syntrophicum]